MVTMEIIIERTDRLCWRGSESYREREVEEKDNGRGGEKANGWG